MNVIKTELPFITLWLAQPIVALALKSMAILLVAWGLNRLLRRLFNSHALIQHQSGNAWGAALLNAAIKPLIYLIWLIASVSVLTLVHDTFFKHYPSIWLNNTLKMGLLCALIWFGLRVVTLIQQHYLQQKSHENHDKNTIFAVAKCARMIVIIIGGLLILQTLHVGISGLLAFGGLGGAAIAFAAKDLLANFFGGMIVYFDKPFAIGDWIRSPDRNIEGTVEYIGWRSCRIRTFEQRPLYIPNALFTTISIENASRMTHRRINTTVGVRYDDAAKISAIVTDIKNWLLTYSALDQTQTTTVNFVNFGNSSLDLMVYAYTKTIAWVDFLNIQQTVYLKIIDIINQYGAQCAFPTTTIDMPENMMPHLVTKKPNYADAT